MIDTEPFEKMGDFMVIETIHDDAVDFDGKCWIVDAFLDVVEDAVKPDGEEIVKEMLK